MLGQADDGSRSGAGTRRRFPAAHQVDSYRGPRELTADTGGIDEIDWTAPKWGSCSVHTMILRSKSSADMADVDLEAFKMSIFCNWLFSLDTSVLEVAHR